MSKNSKPRKARRNRSASIPMMRETRDMMAMSLHQAVETLIHAPSVETYNAMSLQLVTMGRVLGKQDYMERAKRAMLDVFSRFERVNRMGVSDTEAEMLRQASGAIDAALAYVKVDKLAAAELKTAAWCRENNVAA